MGVLLWTKPLNVVSPDGRAHPNPSLLLRHLRFFFPSAVDISELTFLKGH